MEINQPKSVKSKMRGCKLKSGVNWQGLYSEKYEADGLKTRTARVQKLW